MNRTLGPVWAPDAGIAGSAAEDSSGFIADTLPERGRSREIDPYDDADYVVEGDDDVPQTQPELAGKSRDEIMQELLKAQEAVAAEKARADPVAALQQTLQQVLQPQRGQPQEVVPGWQRQGQMPQQQQQTQESPEQRKARMQELWLSDPDAAARQVAVEQQSQLAMLVANNQAQMSRELLVAVPEQKKIYDKYSEEVESEVARMTPLERIQNPRVYQTALEKVKFRHQDDFVQEAVAAQIAAGVQAELQRLGITPGGAQRPQQPVFSGATAPGARPPASRQTVVIPRWVSDEADRVGLEPKFYYQHLKSQGRV